MTLVKLNSEKNKNGNLPAFNTVFDSILNDTFFADRMVSRVPAANISESVDHFHIELAAPGMKKEDFNLKLERDILTVSVDQIHAEEHKDRNYAKREYSFNSFVRSFTLPDSADMDGINAKYEDGILCIDIQKKEEAKMVSRQIEIK